MPAAFVAITAMAPFDRSTMSETAGYLHGMGEDHSATSAPEPSEVCEFAFPGPLRDRLVGAVLRGEKTATSGLLVEWEVEGTPLPVAGTLQTVIDSAARPVGVIETLSVEVIRLGDADLRLALDEGEGFESVAQWRDEHERFWNDEVLPTLPPGSIVALSDETRVIVQRFRLVTTR